MAVLTLPRSRAAVFAITVLVVITGSVGGPVWGEIGTNDPAVRPMYAPAEIVPDRDKATGHIGSRAHGTAGGTVVVDMSHGNRVDEAELQPVVSAITSAGSTVKYAETTAEFRTALHAADALVIIDPGEPYKPKEIDAVETFADNGGRVLLLGEPTRGNLAEGGGRTDRSYVHSISARFGIDFGVGALYDLTENAGNHRNIVATGTDASLAAGVDRTAFYTATPVTIRDGQRLLLAPATTQSDRTGNGPFALAVRAGNVTAVGDSTFVTGGKFRVADNDRLLSNIVSFLLTGNRTRTVLEYPFMIRDDATIRYTSPLLLSTAQRLNNGLREQGLEATIELERRAALPWNTDVLVTSFSYLETHPRVAAHAGIRATDGEVSVPGYTGSSSAVVVVHIPESGYDLVVVSDTPERTADAIGDIAEGEHRDAAVSDSTIVIKGAPDTVFV